MNHFPTTTPTTAPAAGQPGPFPEGFWWGASTSAYQVEGGWDADGKGPSIVDTRTNFPAGKTDYKVASDHYHRFEEDVALFAELGLKAYRFSIAWTRIVPAGTGAVNQAGLDFYGRLIDALIAHHIEPVVTLYHFDLPAPLDEQGGWGNRATIDAFVEYSRIVFEAYGDRVKYWLTINEQNMMVLHGDAVGTTGKSGQTDKKGIHQQNHHMFLAGARASALLHEMVPDAKIGPAPNIVAIYPATPLLDDVVAADDWDAVRNLNYLDVAVRGTYHPLAWRYLVARGWEPTFEEGDAETLAAGRPDFLAFNYYATQTVGASTGTTDDLQSRSAADQQLVRGEVGLYRAVKNEYLRTNAWGWEIDPVGLRTTLRRLNDRYRLPLLITENGIGAHDVLEDGAVHDDYRIDYYRQHVEQLALALGDGVELMGYCPWSAIDLVSTHSGAAKRYGFIHVDRGEFDLRTLNRTRKDSFAWYQRVIATNGRDLGASA